MSTQKAHQICMALEVIVIPVRDTERSLQYYTSLGWRLDADISNGSEYRLVQVTPPGSPCSIHFGRGVTSAAAGSASGMYLVVSDILAARDSLASCGVDVSEVFHRSPGMNKKSGPDPGRRSYASFFSFTDPDGNCWLVQEVKERLPGRRSSVAAAFGSSGDLAEALRRAAEAHGQHEKHADLLDPDWPEWYANYIAREQAHERVTP